MPRIPLDPNVEPDDDGWFPTPAPLLPPPADLTVYEVDAEPVGYLWINAVDWIEVLPERTPFGFARHLGGNMGKTSVLDELDALKVNKGPSCSVGIALARMDADVSGQFEAAMADDARLHVHIAKVLQNRGYDVKEGAVSRHRRGECACGR